MSRRDLLRRLVSICSAGLALPLAIPGLAYLLSPLKKGSGGSSYDALARLSDLKVGEPRAFAVIRDLRDAWVKYPRQPIGAVWLIRQPEGVDPPVVALTAECPHLGCAVALAADGKSFLCPCHNSVFGIDGKPQNAVSPRPMDPLDIQIAKGDDPEIRVKFERFRPQSDRRIPLA